MKEIRHTYVIQLIFMFEETRSMANKKRVRILLDEAVQIEVLRHLAINPTMYLSQCLGIPV